MQVLEDGTSPQLHGAFPTGFSRTRTPQGPTLDLVKPQTPFSFAICAAELGLSLNTNTQEKKDSGKAFFSPVEIILV